MAGVNFCISRKLGGEHVERDDHVGIAASFEIGTTDAHPEQGVATKSNVLGSIIKDDATWGMTRSMEDLPGVRTEADGVAVGKIRVDRRYIQMDGDAQDIAGLLFYILHQKTVVLMGLGFQSEGSEDKAVAHAMIEMAVGAEQMTGSEAFLFDVIDYSLAFFGIVSSTIDDDTLTRLVADHITVFSEHVNGETFDGKHGINGQWIMDNG